MRKEIQRWNMDSLSFHNRWMYETLIHEHNIISDSVKEIEFLDKDNMPFKPLRGFLAKKKMQKYWIDQQIFKSLPLRVGDKIEELKYKEDIIMRSLNPRAFNIISEKKFGTREFIDSFVPFEHTHPEQWMLLKFIALSSMISRTYICIASPSEFGKSSIFDVMHYITDKCPVFKPRSIPGVLNKISGTGNIVFDEIHECKREVKEIIEEFALQIGGSKAVYINGALKSKNTKSTYDCHLQSITFLYNNIDSYNDESAYFEFIFSNNKAIDTRFLKFRLDGKLLEKFSKDFSIPDVAEENRRFYIDFAKQMLYLQDLKKNNGYDLRYTHNSTLDLKGRRKLIYNDIAWLIDMYCESQQEFNKYIELMDNCIMNYRKMINMIDGNQLKQYEEVIE